MELVWLLVGVVLGGWAGFKAAEHIHTTLFKQILTELKVTEADMRRLIKEMDPENPHVATDADLPQVEVKVEQHGNQLLVYRVDTMEFLGQGTDRDQVIASLTERFHSDFKIVLTDDASRELLKPKPAAT